MTARAWQASVSSWVSRLVAVSSVSVYYSNKLVSRVPGGAELDAALITTLEEAGSLAGVARTFVLVAHDGDDREVARVDVRFDPKANALARADERELSAREASATAQVIAASDHRTVQATVKAVTEQNTESHNALVAMVRVFGESAGAVLKGNAEALRALDSRAERDAKEIDRLSAENASLRRRSDELQEIADASMREAERLKAEGKDLVLLCRAAFGDKFREVLSGFLANNTNVAEVLGGAIMAKEQGAS